MLPLNAVAVDGNVVLVLDQDLQRGSDSPVTTLGNGADRPARPATGVLEVRRERH
jgi:hypothetical protein